MGALVDSDLDTPLNMGCKSVRGLSSIMRWDGIYSRYIIMYYRCIRRIVMKYIISNLLQNYLTLPVRYLSMMVIL